MKTWEKHLQEKNRHAARRAQRLTRRVKVRSGATKTARLGRGR